MFPYSILTSNKQSSKLLQGYLCKPITVCTTKQELTKVQLTYKYVKLSVHQRQYCTDCATVSRECLERMNGQHRPRSKQRVEGG